jgi:hypothetical protein
MNDKYYPRTSMSQMVHSSFIWNSNINMQPVLLSAESGYLSLVCQTNFLLLPEQGGKLSSRNFILNFFDFE